MLMMTARRAFCFPWVRRCLSARATPRDPVPPPKLQQTPSHGAVPEPAPLRAPHPGPQTPNGGWSRGTRAWAAGAALVAGGAAGVYFVPAFGETRKGLYLGWNYPYEVLFKDSYSESAWLVAIGGLTGLGASFAFVRAVGAASGGRGSFLVGVPRTVLAMFSGVVTFSVTMQLGPYVLPPAQRTVKLIMYGIDGLMADTVGRYEGDAPIWEKQDGITVRDVERYLAREATQRATVRAGAEQQQQQQQQEKAQEQQTPSSADTAQSVTALDKLDLAAVDALVDRLTASEADDATHNHKTTEKRGALPQPLLDRHRTLLVSELLRLRREEDLLRSQLTAKQAAMAKLAQSTDHDYLGDAAQDLRRRVSTAEQRKQQLKDRAQRVHGASLTGLCEAEVFVMVHGLEDLRDRQLALALQARELGKFDAMVARKELRSMDAAKRELKRAGADNFGVRISHKARSVKPWRRALANIPDA